VSGSGLKPVRPPAPGGVRLVRMRSCVGERVSVRRPRRSAGGAVCERILQ
jgi:hypothetical protein